MSIFEYLMVLLSVVLSLGLVHILNGLTSLFHNRKRVQWSVVYVLWIVEVMILHFDFWQYTWEFSDQVSFRHIHIVMMFLLASAIYLTASVLVRTMPEDAVIDLSESWESVRHEFLAVYIGYLVLVLILNAMLMEWRAMLWMSGVYVVPFILLGALAFFISNRWVQLMAIVGIVAMDLARYAFVATSIG